MEHYRLWAGSYRQEGDSVLCLEFDGKNLRPLEGWTGLISPSYLLPTEGAVYAVEEYPEGGALAEIRPGRPSFRRYPLPGSGYCHVSLCGGFLYASGYLGGCLTGLEPGSGRVCCHILHQGSGPNPQRQEQAHVHSAWPSPDGKSLFAADLGLDRLFQYRLSPEGGLTPHPAQPWVQTAPGGGPRHLAFHPSGQWAYLVTEMGQLLSAYRFSREESTLELLGSYPVYAGAPRAEDTAADVQVSPDGRFVYASSRGLDRIFSYAVTDTGLDPQGSFPSGGQCPRSFHISPDGKYLAAANQVSGQICLFPRSEGTGALGDMAAAFSLPTVSCVKWEEAGRGAG